MSISTKNMVEVRNKSGFILLRVSDGKRIGFELSGKSKGVKAVWNKKGLAKSAFKYHTGVYYDDQNEYKILEVC